MCFHKYFEKKHVSKKAWKNEQFWLIWTFFFKIHQHRFSKSKGKTKTARFFQQSILKVQKMTAIGNIRGHRKNWLLRFYLLLFLYCVRSIKTFRAQSFTSLMTDLRQDLNRVFSFSRCLNVIFPGRNCSVKTLVN